MSGVELAEKLREKTRFKLRVSVLGIFNGAVHQLPVIVY